jgi:hypothetical protein
VTPAASSCPSWWAAVLLGATIGVAFSLLLLVLVDRWLSRSSAGELYDQVRPRRRAGPVELDDCAPEGGHPELEGER